MGVIDAKAKKGDSCDLQRALSELLWLVAGREMRRTRPWAEASAPAGFMITHS